MKLTTQHFLIVPSTGSPIISDSLDHVPWHILAIFSRKPDTGIQVFELNVDEDHMRDVTEDVWREMSNKQTYFRFGLIRWDFDAEEDEQCSEDKPDRFGHSEYGIEARAGSVR